MPFATIHQDTARLLHERGDVSPALADEPEAHLHFDRVARVWWAHGAEAVSQPHFTVTLELPGEPAEVA